jgi:hypothetical protein
MPDAVPRPQSEQDPCGISVAVRLHLHRFHQARMLAVTDEATIVTVLAGHGPCPAAPPLANKSHFSSHSPPTDRSSRLLPPNSPVPFLQPRAASVQATECEHRLPPFHLALPLPVPRFLPLPAAVCRGVSLSHSLSPSLFPAPTPSPSLSLFPSLLLLAVQAVGHGGTRFSTQLAKGAVVRVRGSSGVLSAKVAQVCLAAPSPSLPRLSHAEP